MNRPRQRQHRQLAITRKIDEFHFIKMVVRALAVAAYVGVTE